MAIPRRVCDHRKNRRPPEKTAGVRLRNVQIVGVGQLPVNKEATVRGRYLGATAVGAALADAGVAADRVGALYVGNMMSGILANQSQVGGLIADYAGLSGIE